MKIYDTFGQDNSIIASAAKTCYRSEDKTQKTNDEFVTMLKTSSHLAMLEFSWYVFRIRALGPNAEVLNKEAYNYYLTAKYLNTTITDKGVILSGNGRAWLEYLQAQHWNFADEAIAWKLQKQNKVLFSDLKATGANNRYTVDVLNEKAVSELDDINKGYHMWVAVKFNQVSRGFTAEFNRHRTHSIAEMSTRYVNMENFRFIIDNSKFDIGDNLVVDDLVSHIQNVYKYFKSKSYTNDVVRQILPLGLSTEICHASNLNGWLHFFKLRCSEKAHYEIRKIAGKLREQFIERGFIDVS